MQSISDTEQMEDLLKIDADSFTTIIDEGIEIEGVIRCNSGKSILISGTFFGDVVSNGCVVINESGKVCGSVKALSIKIAGTIDQPSGKSCTVFVEDVIVVAKTAVLNVSTLTYGGINMELGATISVSGAMRTLPKGIAEVTEQPEKVNTSAEFPSYLQALPSEARVHADFPSFANVSVLGAREA